MPIRIPRSLARGPEPELDLTPMIDCVFQLVIFFALVNEFSAADHTKVSLPEAPKTAAIERRGEDPSLVTVTIVAPDETSEGIDRNLPPIVYRGRQAPDMPTLRRWLREASDPINHPDPLKPTVPSAGGLRPSNRTLRIRCDRERDFAWVAAVIAIAGPVPENHPDIEASECPMLIKIDIATRVREERR